MKVESEAISDIDYDAPRRKLFIRFRGGARYLYVDVPAAVYKAFLQAASKGAFFRDQILDRYPYNRLTY